MRLLRHVSTRPLAQVRGAAGGLPAAGFGWRPQKTNLHKHLGAFQPTALRASSLPFACQEARPKREMRLHPSPRGRCLPLPALCKVVPYILGTRVAVGQIAGHQP